MLEDIIKELSRISSHKFSPAMYLTGEIEKLIERIKLSVGKDNLISEKKAKSIVPSIEEEISTLKTAIDKLDSDLSKGRKKKKVISKVIDNEDTVIFGDK